MSASQTSAEAVPLILVGGGSDIIPQQFTMTGVSHVIKPDHYSVANAVGAALSQVSGEWQRGGRSAESGVR